MKWITYIDIDMIDIAGKINQTVMIQYTAQQAESEDQKPRVRRVWVNHDFVNILNNSWTGVAAAGPTRPSRALFNMLARSACMFNREHFNSITYMGGPPGDAAQWLDQRPSAGVVVRIWLNTVRTFEIICTQTGGEMKNHFPSKLLKKGKFKWVKVSK